MDRSKSEEAAAAAHAADGVHSVSLVHSPEAQGSAGAGFHGNPPVNSTPPSVMAASQPMLLCVCVCVIRLFL